jgi:mRNA interferase HigB
MRIINEVALDRFIRNHSDARNWIESWLRNARETDWTSIQEIKKTYPATDGGVKVASGGTVTVFNVCGNKYRMIASVIYAAATIIVHELMTHAEYSKNHWKKRY